MRAAPLFRALSAALLVSGASRLASADDTCLQIRPTDPGGYVGYEYADAPALYFDGAYARIHYAASGVSAPSLTSTRDDGVPDDVVRAAEVADEALAVFASAGYLAPMSDGDYPVCSSNGGDGRFDVYLIAFTASDGLMTTEVCTEGTTSRCSGFALVESKPQNRGYKNFDEGARIIIPHEIFHAVQNAYNAELDRFWAEGSAQWATKQLYPDTRDFERLLPAFFADLSRSIDLPPGGVSASYLYGSGVWPLFLTERHGETIVREILEDSMATGSNALTAAANVLTQKGSSLGNEIVHFGTWNAATGKRAGVGGYPDAATYPEAKLQQVALGDDIAAKLAGVGSRLYVSDEGGVWTIDADTSRIDALLVPLENGKARLDLVTPLPAQTDGAAIVVVSGQTTKKTDAAFTLHLRTLDDEQPGTGGSSGSGGSEVGGAGGSESGGSAGSEAAGAGGSDTAGTGGSAAAGSAGSAGSEATGGSGEVPGKDDEEIVDGKPKHDAPVPAPRAVRVESVGGCSFSNERTRPNELFTLVVGASLIAVSGGRRRRARSPRSA